MKKYYIALVFSSIAIFSLSIWLYGTYFDPFFSPRFNGYAIALAIYVVIGDIICLVAMHNADKFTQKFISDSKEYIKKIKEELNEI